MVGVLELRRLRTAQLRMTRRLPKWWPQPGENGHMSSNAPPAGRKPCGPPQMCVVGRTRLCFSGGIGRVMPPDSSTASPFVVWGGRYGRGYVTSTPTLPAAPEGVQAPQEASLGRSLADACRDSLRQRNYVDGSGSGSRLLGRTISESATKLSCGADRFAARTATLEERPWRAGGTNT